MQPLRISFRVSPFPTTFPSSLCCCGFRWWSSLRGRAVVARSNRFVLTSLFFFQFFSLDFFFVWFPRWFPSCFVFFLESGFFFFYQKSCRLAMDFLLLRVFFCCVLPGFQLAGRILFFLGVFCLFALRVSPSFQLRAAVRRGRLVTRSAAKRRRFMAFFIICSDSDSKKKEHKRESPRRLMKYHLSGSCYFAQRMRKKSSPETKKTDFFADGDSPPGLALRMQMRSATQCVASRNDQ